eukprot:COSAG01_NODE_58989_length_302_cov_8.576355_1_plen_68_part_10
MNSLGKQAKPSVGNRVEQACEQGTVPCVPCGVRSPDLPAPITHAPGFWWHEHLTLDKPGAAHLPGTQP